MAQAHLSALKRKHEALEEKIRQESAHAAKDESAIRRLKEQKLHLKEEIARLQGQA